MPTAIDHVVILVEDLDQAVRQYEQLGFTVVPGGKHARYTLSLIHISEPTRPY